MPDRPEHCYGCCHMTVDYSHGTGIYYFGCRLDPKADKGAANYPAGRVDPVSCEKYELEVIRV
jgi:hypothetical protein